MDSASTSRAIGVGALLLLSLTILLTLIQHPIFTLALILILLWLFLHPIEAENLWRSAVPALTEAFAKAVQEASAPAGNISKDLCAAGRNRGVGQEIQNGPNKREQSKRAGKDPESHKSDDGHTEENQKLGERPSNTKSSAEHQQNQTEIPASDDPLLALDSLLTLEDDGGDIEIEPLDFPETPKPLDQPDLLKPISAHLDSKPTDPPMPKVSKQNPSMQDQKNTAEQPNLNENSNGNQPDVIIMNAPTTATYRRHFGGNGEDEFYITSVDYEQFEFEPLIITEQVPRTTEWFEQLTVKQKRELMKEREMRQRLSRSTSRAPT